MSTKLETKAAAVHLWLLPKIALFMLSAPREKTAGTPRRGASKTIERRLPTASGHLIGTTDNPCPACWSPPSRLGSELKVPSARRHALTEPCSLPLIGLAFERNRTKTV